MMANFRDMVQQSVLARGLATIFLFLVLVVALLIGAYDLFAGRDVPPMIYSVLSGGILTSTALIGINLGIILQPSAPPAPPEQAQAAALTTGAKNAIIP